MRFYLSKRFPYLQACFLKRQPLHQHQEYQLIILDEANIAIDLGILDVDEVVDVLKNKPEDMEIVLTGRNAHKKVIEVAHLVSKIEPIKHYWDTGIVARKGIEY